MSIDIEFVKSLLGKRVSVPFDECPPYNGRWTAKKDESIIYAHVVGYFKNEQSFVIVEFEEELIRASCWELHDGVMLLVPLSYMYDTHTKLWAVSPVGLKVADRMRQDKRHSKKPKLPPPKVYPARCVYCTAPARNFGSLIMCSNNNCKSRYDVKASLNLKHNKTSIIRCPFKYKKSGKTCCQRAVSFKKISDGFTDLIYKCAKDHSFALGRALRKGDVVLFTIAGMDNADRIWDGTKWERY